MTDRDLILIMAGAVNSLVLALIQTRGALLALKANDDDDFASQFSDSVESVNECNRNLQSILDDFKENG